MALRKERTLVVVPWEAAKGIALMKRTPGLQVSFPDREDLEYIEALWWRCRYFAERHCHALGDWMDDNEMGRFFEALQDGFYVAPPGG